MGKSSNLQESHCSSLQTISVGSGREVVLTSKGPLKFMYLFVCSERKPTLVCTWDPIRVLTRPHGSPAPAAGCVGGSWCHGEMEVKWSVTGKLSLFTVILEPTWHAPQTSSPTFAATRSGLVKPRASLQPIYRHGREIIEFSSEIMIHLIFLFSDVGMSEADLQNSKYSNAS